MWHTNTHLGLCWGYFFFFFSCQKKLKIGCEADKNRKRVNQPKIQKLKKKLKKGKKRKKKKTTTTKQKHQLA